MKQSFLFFTELKLNVSFVSATICHNLLVIAKEVRKSRNDTVMVIVNIGSNFFCCNFGIIVFYFYLFISLIVTTLFPK